MRAENGRLMNRVRASLAWLAALAFVVCAIGLTARLAAATDHGPGPAASRVAAPTFSFEAGGATLAGTQVGFCGAKRANSPARSLCKKLKRGVAPESGQSPVVFVESVRLRLTTLLIAESVPDVAFLAGGTPPDLSLRAPPAV